MSAAAFALFATKADAATLTFNPGGATWDTTNTYWNAGATAWTNGDDAIFGAAGAQSVNLTTNINATSITIQAAGYNISQNGNTLTVGSGGISTTATASLSGFTMGANQTVDVGSSSTLNAGTVVGAAQTLTKSGAGTLNVGTSNLGGVILNAGTISGGTLSSASAFDLRAGTVSATLGGSFGINKTTGGIVILSGNNSSLSGAVNVSAGSLVAQNANALGSGAVTVTGADLTLRSDTNTTFANDVTLDATSTVTVDRVTSGANVTHTLSGTTTLSGDTLNVVRGGNVTGTATLNVANLDIAGANTTFNVGTGALLDVASIIDSVGGGIVIKTGSNVFNTTLNSDSIGIDVQAGTMNATTNSQFLGSVSNATTLNIINNVSPVSTLYLQSLTGVGTTTISVGNAEIHSVIGADGTGANTLSVANGTLTADLEAGTVSALRLVSATVDANGKTLNATISGSANITNMVSGNLTLSAGSTDLTIQNLTGGNVTTNANSSNIGTLSGNTANLTLNSNTTIGTANGSSNVSVSAGKTLTINGGTFAGSLAGAGNVAIGGTVNLNGNNIDDYTGKTILNAGGAVTYDSAVTLNTLAGSGSATFAGVSTISNIDNGTTATLNNNGTSLTLDQGSFAGTITGAGTLIKSGAGLMTLSGNNIDNYTGATTVTAGGTLAFANGADLSGAGSVTVDGTLNLGGNSIITSLAGASTGIINNSSGLTVSSGTYLGTIVGAGNIQKVTGGGLFLSGAKTLTALDVQAGSVLFDANSTINTLTGSAIVDMVAGQTLTVGSGDFSGTIRSTAAGTGNANLTKNGTGVLTLRGSNIDQFTGTTTVQTGGTLAYVADTAANSTTPAGIILSNLAVETNATVKLTSSATVKTAAAIVNAVSGNGTIEVNTDHNLQFELTPANSSTFNGRITGIGGITRTGTVGGAGTGGGTLTLNGISDYQGATNISRGRVNVNGSIAGFGVFVGGTLGGSGTVNTSVTVNSYGIIAPGNSPGLLTVTGDTVFEAGSNFQAELGGTLAGSQYDQLYVSGGTVNLQSGVGAYGGHNNVYLDVLRFGTTFQPAWGDQFTVIRTNSPTGITGTFGGMSSNFTTFLIYDNNAAAHQNAVIYGTGLTSNQTFADRFTTANQKAIATGLWNGGLTNANYVDTTTSVLRTDLVRFTDSNTANGKAVVALLTSGANAGAVLNSFSPEPFLGLNDYAVTTIRTATDAALAQSAMVIKGRWSAGFSFSNAANRFTGGSDSSFNRSLNSSNSVINLEYAFNKSTKMGGFVGFNNGSTRTSSSSIDYDGKVFGLTGFKRLGRQHPIFFKAAVAYATLGFSSSRTDALGTSSTGNNSLNGTIFQVTASMPTYRSSKLTVSPLLGILRGSSSSSAFTETGTGANLSVDKASFTSTRALLGVAFDYRATTSLNLGAQLSYEHEFSGSRDVTARLGSSSFTVNNDDAGNTLALGLNAGYDISNSTRLNLGAELRHNGDYSNDHRYNAGVNVRF